MANRALKSVPPAPEDTPTVLDAPTAAPDHAEQKPAAEEARRAPDAPPVVPAHPNERAAKAAPPRRRSLIRWGLFALLPVALLGGGYWYVTGGQILSTDDAYVDAEKVGISTDVAGIVKDIDVKDNEHVTAGQALYHLDPRKFQIALDNAKASLAETALSIDAMKQDYQRMLSDAAAEQAQVQLDQTNYTRDSTLLHSGTVSQSIYDQAKSTLDTDKNKLESLQQQAQMQLAKLGGNADIDVREHPQYRQVLAQVEEAQRELDHATVVAPFAGTVTDVSSIAVGKYLAASTTAFFLVDTDHVWISANPKETELTYVRPGQPVTVTVDTYPDVVWHGTVQSVSPAAAQEFSLLPSENTSGNWVKVVQRVPMRVSVDTGNQQPPLRAGMSAVVDINTGHARGFPHFLTALFGRW